MSDGPPTPEIVVAGIRLLPLAARAAWLPEVQTLLVADVHLGKARSFTTWGVPVPGDVDAATLARLTTVIEAAAARRLVVLGDWLHGPRALDAVLLQRLESWRRRHAEVEIIVIGGNHDRRAPRLPPALDIDCVDGPITLPDAAGLVLDHDPVTRSPRPTTGDGYRLAGHWHPVVRLRGRADALRLPCFISAPARVCCRHSASSPVVIPSGNGPATACSSRPAIGSANCRQCRLFPAWPLSTDSHCCAVAAVPARFAAYQPAATICRSVAPAGACQRTLDQSRPEGNLGPGFRLRAHQARTCVADREHRGGPDAIRRLRRQDRLIAWNEPYERVHALAFEKLREKADRDELYYADLVRATARETMPASRRRGLRQESGPGPARCRWRRRRSRVSGAGWFRISKFRTRSGAVAGFAIDITELKRREARLEEEIRRRMELEDLLRIQMNTDALTRVSARAAFLAQAETDFQRSLLSDHDLAVVMMDIDLFKNVNDVHGHGVGDTVLTQVARTATDCLRKDIDLIGRMGGEEFALLLLNTGRDGAVRCAEQIRSRIAALGFEGTGGSFGITASFGVTQRSAEDPSLSAMLSRADQALYVAKRAGRNRVVATPS